MHAMESAAAAADECLSGSTLPYGSSASDPGPCKVKMRDKRKDSRTRKPDRVQKRSPRSGRLPLKSGHSPDERSSHELQRKLFRAEEAFVVLQHTAAMEVTTKDRIVSDEVEALKCSLRSEIGEQRQEAGSIIDAHSRSELQMAIRNMQAELLEERRKQQMKNDALQQELRDRLATVSGRVSAEMAKNEVDQVAELNMVKSEMQSRASADYSALVNAESASLREKMRMEENVHSQLLRTEAERQEMMMALQAERQKAEQFQSQLVIAEKRR